VQRIRILLVEEMPRMLRDIIEDAVGTRTDMAIVARVARTHELRAAVDRTAVDIVILHVAEEGELESFDDMLFAHPRIRLLALTGDARAASIYALRPHMDPMRVVSPQGIVEAIRSAVPVPAQ
jgi:hypothetical protein